jgi:hypothetical protein
MRRTAVPLYRAHGNEVTSRPRYLFIYLPTCPRACLSTCLPASLRYLATLGVPSLYRLGHKQAATLFYTTLEFRLRCSPSTYNFPTLSAAQLSIRRYPVYSAPRSPFFLYHHPHTSYPFTSSCPLPKSISLRQQRISSCIRTRASRCRRRAHAKAFPFHPHVYVLTTVTYTNHPMLRVDGALVTVVTFVFSTLR